MNLDIVITIPKKEIPVFYQELANMQQETNLKKSVKVAQLPSMADIGDACFIVIDGKIRHKSLIVGLQVKEFKCTTTGKTWVGNFIEFKNVEDFNGSNVMGFQGLRYVWWN